MNIKLRCVVRKVLGVRETDELLRCGRWFAGAALSMSVVVIVLCRLHLEMDDQTLNDVIALDV